MQGQDILEALELLDESLAVEIVEITKQPRGVLVESLEFGVSFFFSSFHQSDDDVAEVVRRVSEEAIEDLVARWLRAVGSGLSCHGSDERALLLGTCPGRDRFGPPHVFRHGSGQPT